MTLLAAPTDFQRDRWGRPLVADPVTGKMVPYGRPSSFGKCIDDTYNLELWAKRKVAQGIMLDRSIYATAVSLPIDDTSKDNKSAWNTVCEKALTAAKTHAAADTGTALHLMTERIDRGETLDLPEVFAADVDAYRAALAAAGLSVVPGQVEIHVVCDALELAGTFDRIVTDGTRYFIADLKTGTSVDYPHGYAVQLAIYSRAQGYDIAENKRYDLPPVDQATGIIIHLPAGRGECFVRPIDLEAGWEAAQLAARVKKWQKKKDLLGGTMVKPASPLRAAQAAVKAVDAAHPAPVADVPTFRVKTDPDEGGQADPRAVALLRQRLNELAKADVGARKWLEGLMREAVAAGCTLDLKANPSLRRFEACRGLYLIAKSDDRDLGLLPLLILVLGDLQPSIPLGAYVGSLDVHEATQFARYCDQLVVEAIDAADAVA
jgi:hypothetical protein